VAGSRARASSPYRPEEMAGVFMRLPFLPPDRHTGRSQSGNGYLRRSTSSPAKVSTQHMVLGTSCWLWGGNVRNAKDDGSVVVVQEPEEGKKPEYGVMKARRGGRTGRPNPRYMGAHWAILGPFPL
jgi:hypothetical protein